MYIENTKAVLGLYFSFILVILCVIVSSCPSSPTIDDEKLSHNTTPLQKIVLTAPDACTCTHFVHWHDRAFNEVNDSLIESCIAKYNITVDGEKGVLSTPECTTWE